jgi:signal-transduction protein with cAMP-binding, CBS, and nucleotidyltransferase domain
VIAEQLQKTDLFREVELTDLQALVERMQEEHYDSGAVLFRAGDTGDTMYIIQSGNIRIYMNDETGKEIALTQYGKNEIFGESPSHNRVRGPLLITGALIVIVACLALCALWLKSHHDHNEADGSAKVFAAQAN